MSSRDATSQPSINAPSKFARLVEEEIPIQATNLPINGGLPSCVTLFDNFLLCFGASELRRVCMMHSRCITIAQPSANNSLRSIDMEQPENVQQNGMTSSSAWRIDL